MSRQKRTLLRIIGSAVCFLALLLLTHLVRLPLLAELMLYLLAYIWIGWDIVLEALGGPKPKKWNCYYVCISQDKE